MASKGTVLLKNTFLIKDYIEKNIRQKIYPNAELLGNILNLQHRDENVLSAVNKIKHQIVPFSNLKLHHLTIALSV